MRVNLNCLAFVCFVLLASSGLYAQENGGFWVTGTGSAFLNEDITPAEAKHKARKRARADAIERALGVSITAERYLQQFEVSREMGEVVESGESFADYIRESRRGRIVDEDEWQENSEVINMDGDEVIKYRASNRFLIIEEESTPDPNFKVGLQLSQSQYQEGDGVSFRVNATQDCYLTIFNVAANDSVYLIFPNEIEKSNWLSAEETRTIPGFGYSFTASLPPGKKAAMESIIVVATKDSVIFRGREITTSGIGYATVWKTGLNQVWRWVSEIDPARRVEAIASFKIFK